LKVYSIIEEEDESHVIVEKHKLITPYKTLDSPKRKKGGLKSLSLSSSSSTTTIRPPPTSEIIASIGVTAPKIVTTTYIYAL
jgi:hypothetical protein